MLLSVAPLHPKPMDMCAHIQTHTHTQVQACLNTGGKKSYYDSFYHEGSCVHHRVQHLIKFCVPTFGNLS